MQDVSSDLIRGNIDTIILKTMLGGDMYGLDIIREVENKSNGTYNLKQPTLYSCLKRLENQELISSYWLDSDIGGKRHYYKLTEKGRETIKSKQEEWSKSKFIIDNLLGDFNSDTYRLVKKEEYDQIINGIPKTIYVQSDSSKTNDNSNDSVADDFLIDFPELSENYFEQNASSPVTEIEETIPEEENYDEFFEESNFNQTTQNNDSYAENDEFETEKMQNYNKNDENQDILTPLQENLQTKSVLDSTPQANSNNETYQNNFNNLLNFKAPEIDNSQPDLVAISKDKKLYDIISSYNEIEEKEKKENQPHGAYQQNFFTTLSSTYREKVDTAISNFVENISKFNDLSKNVESETKDNSSETDQQSTDSQKTQNQPKLVSDSEIQLPDLEYNSEIKVKNEDVLGELSTLSAENRFLVKFENDDGYTSAKDETQKTDSKQTKTDFSSDFSPSQDDNTQNSYYSKPLSSKDSEITYASESSIKSPEINDIYSNVSMQNNTENTFDYKNNNVTSPYNTQNYSKPEPPQNTSFETYDISGKSDSEFDISNIYSSEKFDADYKKKVSELSGYTKTTPAKVAFTSPAKDFQTLSAEYKSEGIEVREYSKRNSKSNSKKYVLTNKINLIKSLVLFFVYILILFLSYILAEKSNLKNMTGFSVSYFFFGLIPFIIYSFYSIINYIINPSKTSPLKFSQRASLLVSLVFTVQFLVITYCLNLQMGFYSFSQESYNHLLWIIPSIISPAPIFLSIIHGLLLKSGNFCE